MVITTWNGSNGWKLPTKEELNAAYLELFASDKPLAGDTNRYWSSSVTVNDYAWAQYFYNGSQGNYGTTGSDYVRVVRGF